MTLAKMCKATINHESLISQFELCPHHAPRTSQALTVLFEPSLRVTMAHFCALHNDDAVCYALSTLQLLYSCRSFRFYIIENIQHGEVHQVTGSLFQDMMVSC